MDPERHEELKRRFNFEAWRERNLLRSTATLKSFEIGENHMPGWQICRRSYDSTIRPPVAKTIWGRRELSNEQLLNIEVRTCDSLQAAHTHLLELLGEFQSTALKERPELNIGDVAFGISDPTMLLFARANLVVLARNAGPQLVSVHDVAGRLDAEILSQLRRGENPQVP